jgi:hypothetical protein
VVVARLSIRPTTLANTAPSADVYDFEKHLNQQNGVAVD